MNGCWKGTVVDCRHLDGFVVDLTTGRDRLRFFFQLLLPF